MSTTTESYNYFISNELPITNLDDFHAIPVGFWYEGCQSISTKNDIAKMLHFRYQGSIDITELVENRLDQSSGGTEETKTDSDGTILPPPPPDYLRHPSTDNQAPGIPKLFLKDLGNNNDLVPLYDNVKELLSTHAKSTFVDDADRSNRLKNHITILLGNMSIQAVIGDTIMPIRNRLNLKKALIHAWKYYQSDPSNILTPIEIYWHLHDVYPSVPLPNFQVSNLALLAKKIQGSS